MRKIFNFYGALEILKKEFVSYSLLGLAFLTLAYFSARNELTLKPPNLPLSTLILLVLFLISFLVWIRVPARRNLIRECFVLVLGAFGIFVIYPVIIDWLARVGWVKLIWREIPPFRVFAEAFSYALSIAIALLVMYFGYGRDLLTRYFLRVEIYLKDFATIFFLLGLTIIFLLLWFKFGATGKESWSTLGLGYVGAIFLGVISSIGNAFAEEFWFRGFFLGTFSRMTSPAVANFLQALLFGFIHFKDGIPQGVSGWLLAGIWGLILGYWTILRLSLASALILHVLTDLFIYFFVNNLF